MPLSQCKLCAVGILHIFNFSEIEVSDTASGVIPVVIEIIRQAYNAFRCFIHCNIKQHVLADHHICSKTEIADHFPSYHKQAHHTERSFRCQNGINALFFFLIAQFQPVRCKGFCHFTGNLRIDICTIHIERNNIAGILL